MRGSDRPHRLLVTDLDGTFIGDDAATCDLWVELDASGIGVGFATGRHLTSVQAFYDRLGTQRRALACICMVGTEIWLLDDSGYRKDPRWSRHIAEGWERDRVSRFVAERIAGAELQPAEWQSPLKISYFLPAGSGDQVERLEADMARASLAATTVFSADRFLDILPARSGKGSAVAHLAADLELSPGDVVVAGDTGNDLDMMRPELGFRSIAVGNATAELATHVGPAHYRARADHALGIREGLVHHGWLAP